MRTRSRGVTLVEVLVAVVVCGAGLAIAAGGVSSILKADVYAEDLTRAADHLELLLSRVEGEVLPRESAKGDFTADGAPELRWELVVTPGDREGLTDVRAIVTWTRWSQERELSVSRLVFVDPQAGTQ